MKLNPSNKKSLSVALSVFTGAVLGYAYYFFIGCRTGSCPIQSNPYISTIYGAVIGFVFSFPSKKKEANNETGNGNN